MYSHNERGSKVCLPIISNLTVMAASNHPHNYNPPLIKSCLRPDNGVYQNLYYIHYKYYIIIIILLFFFPKRYC